MSVTKGVTKPVTCVMFSGVTDVTLGPPLKRGEVHTSRTIQSPSSSRRHGGEDLLGLADRIRRLSPSHRDPEAFHIEKDLIASEIRRVALEVRHG
jgi:hypothetical protein